MQSKVKVTDLKPTKAVKGGMETVPGSSHGKSDTPGVTIGKPLVGPKPIK